MSKEEKAKAEAEAKAKAEAEEKAKAEAEAKAKAPLPGAPVVEAKPKDTLDDPPIDPSKPYIFKVTTPRTVNLTGTRTALVSDGLGGHVVQPVAGPVKAVFNSGFFVCTPEWAESQGLTQVQAVRLLRKYCREEPAAAEIGSQEYLQLLKQRDALDDKIKLVSGARSTGAVTGTNAGPSLPKADG